MRISKLFMPTLREVPAEAEISSHQLMLRAGLIRKLASGVYNYLPIGLRVLRNIESIIREEMDGAGAQEILCSALIPSELWRESGRWEAFGPEMFRLSDRNDREFCLGPTHEEVFTDLVKSEIKSYKDLPLSLYQIQTKYRDERRPRFGVIRSREFLMKDAYSFDVSYEGLDKSFEAMHKAYRNIFNRCSLNFSPVEADSGAMGGTGSIEFMVKSDIGEDEIVFCTECDYASNLEKASPAHITEASEVKMGNVEKVFTPHVGTIEELVEFLKTTPGRFAKTLIYKTDGRVIGVMVRGDRTVNETKVLNYLGNVDIELADAETVVNATGATVGFAGPIDLKVDELLVDFEVINIRNMVVGANETDYHYLNVNYERDFKGTIGDFRNMEEGDLCPVCGAKIRIDRGIEVGHIFKLGTKYSVNLNANFTDENGAERPIIMGCYGIGINRTMAAIIEQNHDDKGIIWPFEVAPYMVYIVPVQVKNEIQSKLAEDMYEKLSHAGIEVLIDDRDERAGVKFNDADMIGIPIRITVGKRAGEGIVELKLRKDQSAIELTVEEALKNVIGMVNLKNRD